MSNQKKPAEGDRIDIGGKLPQFDVFAKFAYRELVYDNLTWIRVADPKAGKVDDVLYSTNAEIHGYQLKWSNKEKPTPFSYNDFLPLLKECLSGWKELKVEHASENKRVIVHLLTNRPISSNDAMKDKNIVIGSFSDFLNEVWKKLKINQDYDQKKWKAIIDEIKSSCSLSDSDFKEFIDHFEFHSNYTHHEIKISNFDTNKLDADLIQFSRFLLEEVADKKRTIHYTWQELINALGPSWQMRFKTTFNHELIIDRSTYQPIESTLEELNEKLNINNSGYLFVVGGPGTGKSTLLTDWAKNRIERVVKYYAFDFSNPSSMLNDYQRGEAVNLFFDIVLQIKNTRLVRENIQPHKDLTYLKTAFEKQLIALGDDYEESGMKTIIVIDGLDHIPREYIQTNNTFLAHLPNPDLLPKGVYIVLGSQSYDLNDLSTEIKAEFVKPERKIQIAALGKKEVFKYINKRMVIPLTDEQKQIIFEKSQGHPLYLSYFIQKLTDAENINELIDDFDQIQDNIEIYYQKIWGPISKNIELIELLGFIARINGAVSPEFIKEWSFSLGVIKEFSVKAKFLFDNSNSGWVFFHNSFRQFLIHNTSIDLLTNEFDKVINNNYHSKLAGFYSTSAVERSWKKSYHLYSAEKYDDFLQSSHPNLLVEQFLDFRPIEEIRREITLGIEVAKKRLDPYLLVRYLFALSEFHQRTDNFEPLSFFEEFLELKEFGIAKSYLRNGKTLLCNESFALSAASTFMKFEDRTEANILFNLAEPNYILDTGIVVKDDFRYDEIENVLEKWCEVAHHFYSISDILAKINNINFQIDENRRSFENKESDLRITLLQSLGNSLIGQRKWEELEILINQLDQSIQEERNIIFILHRDAIDTSTIDNDSSTAEKWLSSLLQRFEPDETKPTGRIYIADLIYKVTQNIELVKVWIDNINQPPLPKSDRLGHSGSIAAFLPKIKLNKLLNLCGLGVPITTASPSAPSNSDESVAVDFERMLCLITQIFSNGLQDISLTSPLIQLVTPIVRFFYRDLGHRNFYWTSLRYKKGEYFDFLIYSVSLHGKGSLNQLGDFLIQEFKKEPKYWAPSNQRKVIDSLFEYGFDKNKVQQQLLSIETLMLKDQDLNTRLEECSAQVKSWIQVANHEKAREWIRITLKESLGVGYSSDYQFNSWIRWLKKINEIDSSGAKDRIHWFLSYLPILDQTTESGNQIAEELLKATFQWDFSGGKDELEWLLDKGIIDFEEAECILIENYLEQARTVEELNKVIHLYTDVFLLISTGHSDEIVKSCLTKGYALGKEEFLEANLMRLVSSIKTKAFEGTRISLLKVIHEFIETNQIDIKKYNLNFDVQDNESATDNSGSDNQLVLTINRQRLTEKEVLDRVQNYDDFKMLFDSESKENSYFKWKPVIEKIGENLSVEQIKELAQTKGLRDRKPEFLAILSSYCLKLGNNALAAELAEKALDTSSEFGWDQFFDGGSRIISFLALKQVDEEKSISKAFEYLAYDSINNSNPSQFTLNYDRILPCIASSYDINQMWEEVSSYLNRLMSTSKRELDLPGLDPSNNPISQTLFDHIFYLARHRVNIVSQNAQTLLAILLHEKETHALEGLKNFLTNGDSDKEIFINVMIRCKLLNKRTVLDFFTNEIEELSVSKNYYIRFNASNILTFLSKSVPIAESIDLPIIYDLHLEEKLKPDFGVKPDPLDPKFDLKNPQDLIKPYDSSINLISEMTGFPKANLLYRMEALMNDLDIPYHWTEEYEMKLRSHLESIHLNYSYPRPRARTAKRALMYLITELIDAEEIDETEVENCFIMHDHEVHFFPETEKPNFMSRLTEERHFVSSDWVLKIDSSERLKQTTKRLVENRLIIGEYSKQRNLEWGKPTEIFMMKVNVKDYKQEASHHIFGSLFETLSSDYHFANTTSRSIIVIRNHLFDQFDLKSNWIALNPVLARHLKWKPSKEHLFAWEDKNGVLMVESIYWCDGNIDIPPPRFEYEVGQGWYILASAEAIKQIKEVEPNLTIEIGVERYCYSEGDHITETRKSISRFES